MKDFIFIYPHITNGFYHGCKHHMGTGYIRAFGDYPSSSVDAYLSNNSLTWDETAEEICNLAITGVGFTVYDTNYPFIKVLANKIKEKKPELLIICGGPSATVTSEKIMDDCKAIDICAIGEGEETFKEIYLSDFKKLNHIQGLVIRNKDGYYHTEQRKIYKKSRHKELEGIPSPYLKGIIPLSKAHHTGILTTRGCNNLCTYCQFTALGHFIIRRYPEEQVIEEVKAICNYWRQKDKKITIHFHDDNFTWDIKRAVRILREIEKFRPSNVNFWLEGRADNIKDNDFYEAAYNAGVRGINFGLESAVPEVLRR